MEAGPRPTRLRGDCRQTNQVQRNHNRVEKKLIRNIKRLFVIANILTFIVCVHFYEMIDVKFRCLMDGLINVCLGM